ncbi:MAG: type I-D CRISPR-associated helicase Cas3' [Spirochaetaceae bacterium]|nr:type I-D CRISPR-associated helicase Cas3' [Spirochaetaceae bacterium]
MIIRAHSVPTMPSGLSPMQERLLNSDKLVRLVSAPTGSGKSYAFMRAVLDDNAHVLFVVPTKRLLQNLIDDARDQAREHLRRRGLPDAAVDTWIAEHMIEWSGNQVADESGRLATTRVRQLLGGGTDADGRVIFTIPEVVVKMMSGVRVTGASAVSPFLYARTFDHVVFDEFHTIDDRSFGLASLMALLAVTERRGKVSLLSATPIDVTVTLARMDVASNDIETIAEEIDDAHPPGNRPIHGNVTLTLRKCTIPDSIALSVDEVRESIGQGRTVIVIYDSLKRLIQDAATVRERLRAVGVPEHRILRINSIDDSERRPGEPRRGRRYADPRQYDVLLCTSSVEIGVTFHSSLMFTEPGHDLASFVQRVGRVARGAVDGQVIVSLAKRDRSRSPWKRRIADVIERNDELSVATFVSEILRDVRNRIQPTHKEAKAAVDAPGEVHFYRRASWRGMYWAALFLVAIRRTKMKVQHSANIRLRQVSPGVVKFVGAKIDEILSVDIVNPNLPRRAQPHKRWVDALLVSALTYRNIGATIVVVDPDGKRHTVTESFLRRATDIPVICTEEDGEQVIRLIAHSLDQEVAESPVKREAQRLTLYIPSPLGDGDFSLSIQEREKDTEQLYRRLVEEWRHRFSVFISSPGEPAQDPRAKVIAAATALIENLGRPPLDEDFEDAGESALFA